ncbi:MAG: choice-of-anchor J domain-containing protein [Bacteroidales bacterium]|nr:choice-of-anchor J domain-containing protein [Bacteroidales bacterium]
MRKHILPFLAMALLMTASFGAKAQQGVENYVSASGYVIYRAPGYYSPDGAYFWEFEEDFDEGHLLDWTLIDADGDAHNWQLPSEGSMGFGNSNGMMVSYSYDNASSSPLTPNNFMVSPRVTLPENAVMLFYASAMDEAYPAEHFGVAISTTVNDDPSAFTLLQEWTLSAKGDENRQGGWHRYSVDLSAYAGQEVYLAIRHFDSTDKFAICVDEIFVGNFNAKFLLYSDIILDGQTVATYQYGRHYLLNTDGFSDGSSHTTTIRAYYEDGTMLENECAWTYRTPDHFQGSPNGLHAESDGNQVQLSWTLPEMNVPFPVEELYYDFADSTLMDLTLIDANNDGQNFRVYPYGGYNGGIGLRSWSWMAGMDELNPDNFIVTPRLTPTANGRITFMACDADMPGIAPDPEHFGVAVSTSGNTNPSDFTMIQEWNSTGTYTEYSADLSAYAGQQIYVAIRHFNTTGDTYFLCVDDIKVTGIEAEVTRPAIGALVYADNELIATLNHGETSFTHDVNRYTSDYCIRIIQDGSRETGDYYALAAPQCAEAELDCVAPKNLRAENLGDKVRISWEREIYTGFEEDPQGWTFLDADGDGQIFGIYNGGGMNSDGSVNTTNTNASLSSFSYMNGLGALQPDNYAFMPKVKVLENASMTFYAAGYDPSYPTEHFGVAVASSDGLTITTIAEWDSSNPYQAYSVDLSAYVGQEIYLGFRHFTHISNYSLVIDNITVTNVAWVGTTSETYGYYVYRSTDGQNYGLIGIATGTDMHFDDHDTSSETFYYQVTAINTIVGGTCESAPAMSADGIHDFVTVHTDGIEENGPSTPSTGSGTEGSGTLTVYPNPTNGILFVETVCTPSLPLETYRITNTLGQTVLVGQITGETQQIDVTNLPQGMYFIAIDGVTQKFVVK